MSKQRRQFTDELKAEVVALCRAGDRSCGQVAQDLGLVESVVSRWMQKASTSKAPATKVGAGDLSAGERDELARLRKEKAHFPITLLCEVLEVSRSGFHAWRTRPQSPRAKQNAVLAEAVTEVHQSSRGTYASPRGHAELRHRGVPVGKKRVARLMRERGLVARRRRPFRPKTTDSNHAHPIADNKLDRVFTRPQPHQAVFEYIEIFYNRRRRHSSLGYLSPAEFEANFKQPVESLA